MLNFPMPLAKVGNSATLTSLNTTKTLTCPANARGVLVQARTQDVYFELGDVTPTTSSFVLRQTDGMVLIGLEEGWVLSFLEVSASATLVYQYVMPSDA
jgi:hypothetical protein